MSKESSSGKASVKSPQGDSPSGPVVKNPPSKAGDMGSIPGQRTNIPHATEPLIPCATLSKPVCCNY